jgi:Zn-dependent protease
VKFSRIELRDLAVCWIVLGLCFSIGVFFNRAGDPFTTTLMNFFARLLATLVAMGAGFVIHELSHKAVSLKFGCQAEFRIWKLGLVVAIATAVLSFGRFLFFAPGAVYTRATRTLTMGEQGKISAAGPIANLILAGLFLAFYSLRRSFDASGDFMFDINLFGVAFKSYPYNVFWLFGLMGFQLNLWLAAFNLVPLGPLDGTVIYRWNKTVWIILALLSWGILLLTSFGVVNL